jgi:hypothetical protein
MAARLTASTSPVPPSYSPAFDTDRPRSSAIIVWNSKSAWSVPCDASAWYGVYAVANSPLDASARTAAGT